MSTNQISSGTVIRLLSTTYKVEANYSNSCKYTWSANLKDSNGNLYELTNIKIPTYDQLGGYQSSGSQYRALRTLGFSYYTSDLDQHNTGNLNRWTVIAIDATSGGEQDQNYVSSPSLKVVPFIELTLK